MLNLTDLFPIYQFCQRCWSGNAEIAGLDIAGLDIDGLDNDGRMCG